MVAFPGTIAHNGAMRAKLHPVPAIGLGTPPAWASWVAAGVLLAGAPPCVGGPADGLTYNRDVRPVLAEHCFACHGPDSASREAGLRLDQRDGAVEFGAITPGDAAASEMIARLLEGDPDLVMPPPKTGKRPTADEIATLRRWIDGGAEYQRHWSLIPPAKPTPPAVRDGAWVRTPIDRFILARLEAEGLQPAPEAPPRLLFRRLHLDITGLPPKPRDVRAFAEDYAARGDAALSAWIDRLMATPAWGEHRGRYWLDAARYGDTHGLHFDNYREIYPYRDWVIRSLNAGKPFDEFAVEQLAGDLLPEPTLDQRIATGLQRCNVTTNEGGTIAEENLANYAADRVQTFGWVFLGLTTNCAQCHDHKFDAFSTRDYYSLAAFFRNTVTPPLDGNRSDGGGPVVVAPAAVDRPRWRALSEQAEAVERSIARRRDTMRGEFRRWALSASAESIAGEVPREGLVAHAPLVGPPNADTPGPSARAEGPLGPAPVFSAGDATAIGPGGDFEIDQPFSYGAWMRIRNETAYGAPLSRMDRDRHQRGWDLFQYTRRVAVHLVDRWPTSALKVTTRDELLEAEQWRHVFVTYDGSAAAGGVRLYVDGRPRALQTDNASLKPDATIRNTQPTRVGGRSDREAYLGAVQDARVYDRRLDEEEVRRLMHVPAAMRVLAKAPEQRTADDDRRLMDYYFAIRDAEHRRLSARLAGLHAERDAIRHRSPKTPIQAEKPGRPMAAVLMRGQYDSPGERVPANTPSALPPLPEDAPRNRLGLARWLFQPGHPLTARVTVNRYWQQVFGAGLVTTASDLGVTGAPPSHPLLLDWLATDFADHGWDIRRTFKQIFMSAAYRQSAVVTPEKLAQDRGNALISRGPRFRMDAEMIRDTALAASGLLSTERYGKGVRPYQPPGVWSVVGLPGGDTRNYRQSRGPDLYRRSVYTFWKRMAPPPNMEVFNAPSRELSCVRRERTSTPLQALVTLNDPTFVEAARRLAERALEAGGGDDAAVLDAAARRLIARPLSDAEHAILLEDLAAYRRHYADRPAEAAELLSVGDSPASAVRPAAELAAVTMVCSQLINLDETLNK